MAQTLGPVVEERHSSVPELCGRWRLRAMVMDAGHYGGWMADQATNTEIVHVLSLGMGAILVHYRVRERES